MSLEPDRPTSALPGTRGSGTTLSEMTWEEAADLASSSLLAIPLGSTEQHGPHLPLDTDTRIAMAMAERLASARGDVVVAPPVPYGSSGEHKGFAGTLSIGAPATEYLFVEVVRSADAFAGVVLISAHGGNALALSRAVRILRAEKRRVLPWWPTLRALREGCPDGIEPDAHAGWVETSLILAIAPELVHLDRAKAGNQRPLNELSHQLFSSGVAGASSNGVLGDPAGASKEHGVALLRALCADLEARVVRWWVNGAR
ncbi:MAG: mycofactocin biosynthesis peptidyl-dipeptidase MftE [Actinobacteria bacterium]|nr:mycofactocin biosynthesis peptidyl-dipeptidase MftE [Actinomycetota bacterium]